MTASYWSGGLPPGVPGNETKELYSTAQGMIGTTLPQGYNDNIGLASGAGPGPGPVNPNNESNNLAVTSLQILDAGTGQAVSSVQSDQNLKAKATFSSTFTVGGYATLRLYKYQADFKVMNEVGSNYTYFEPGATVNQDWDIGNVGANQYKFIASIDYSNSGNDPDSGWSSEKFDGSHNESTYDDNKLVVDLTGSESPPILPQNRLTSNPVWYPPAVWKTIPVYKTVTQDVTIWQPFKIKLKPKPPVRTRLVS